MPYSLRYNFVKKALFFFVPIVGKYVCRRSEMTRRRVISSFQYYSASGITIYPLYKTKIHSRVHEFFSHARSMKLKS